MPNVYLLHGDLTDKELNSLYNHNKVKVHITFTKGEGFGRPLLEASLTGKPIIAPGWSGHMDFLNSEPIPPTPESIASTYISDKSLYALPKSLSPPEYCLLDSLFRA